MKNGTRMIPAYERFDGNVWDRCRAENNVQIRTIGPIYDEVSDSAAEIKSINVGILDSCRPMH